MPRLRLRAKPHKATLPTSFPTFAEIEARNAFQALDLELWPTRGDLDAPLTGFSCSARQWLASTPGKAWVAEYRKDFGTLPAVAKAALPPVAGEGEQT